jgi:urea transport system permease protein
MLMAVLLPGTLAGVFGYLAFRSRIRGVYFSILTQALTYAACLLFFRNSLLLGGNNGFTDFKFILGHDLRSPPRSALFTCQLGLAAARYTCSANGSRKPSSADPARHSRQRKPRAVLRLRHRQFQALHLCLAAIIAGLAGVLYVPQVGIINPSEMATDKSLEAVVWVAVGGRGTLVGPIIGAFAVNA